MFKKIIIGVLLAGSICGCKTVFPPTEDANDRRAVAPTVYSNEESQGDTHTLPWFKPWWVQ